MRLTTLVTALLFVTGCVGGVDEQDPMNNVDGGVVTGTGAKALYKSSVHATMIAKCSGGGCHAQAGVTGIYGFAVADGEASYTQVVGVPTLVGTYTAASAALLTKIDGSHKAVNYTADEKTKITAWLNAENMERNTTGQPPPVDPVAKLAQWSGCMSLTNFQAANMATAWGNLNTISNQKCANCHAQGLYAFISGAGGGALNEAAFFKAVTEQKALLLKYFTVDTLGEVVINHAAFKNAGVDLDDHPHFDPMVNAGMTALGNFYIATKTRLMMNTCDPPRLLP